MSEQTSNIVNVDILKGSKGLLIDINDYNITDKKRNGKMRVVESFKCDKKMILKALNGE